jgi:proteasome accessory factor A
MALHKVLGTETEYGIVVRGDPGFNPAVASSLVVNSYPGERVKVQWSYEEESPGRDARGFGHDTYGLIDPEGAVVNSVLANGARLYVDHAHPEYSGPESYDPLEAALYDKAGEMVMHRASVAATESAGRQVSLYRTTRMARATPTGPTRTTC